MKVSGAGPLRLSGEISDPISGPPREVQDTGSRGRPLSHSGSALPPLPLQLRCQVPGNSYSAVCSEGGMRWVTVAPGAVATKPAPITAQPQDGGVDEP